MSPRARIPTRTPAAPLAAALVRRMRECDLPQAALGERMAHLGVNKSQLSRLLSGETRDPKMTTLLALCRALRLDPTALTLRAGLWDEEEERA